MRFNLKKFLIGIAILVFVLVAATGGALADRLFGIRPLDYFFPKSTSSVISNETKTRLVTEESAVIEVAEAVSPSVVTVTVQTPEQRVLEFDPFSGFRSRVQGGQAQDIGTGFIVSKDGLIVTKFK